MTIEPTIIRVFPRRTSFTPTDALALVGDPGLWLPEAEEVHVSCTFTWDEPECERLWQAWSQYYPKVKYGGPAYSSPIMTFTPGRYVKEGVTFTSRGCNNRCPWCLVPDREGLLKEMPIVQPGHIIQDNNLLQCSHWHQERVYAMLKVQRRAAIFSGGLQTSLLDDWVVEQFAGLRISKIFVACDTDGGLDALREAMQRLRHVFPDPWVMRRTVSCYVLIGRNGIDSEKDRLRAVWDTGAMPFAQLFQPPDKVIHYDRAWRELARAWSRPAIMKSMLGGAADGAKSGRNANHSGVRSDKDHVVPQGTAVGDQLGLRG